MEKENGIKTRNIIIAGIIASLVVLIAIFVSIALEFNLVQNIVMSWILTTAYALFAFFLIDPKLNINPVRYVDRPLVQEIIRIVEKPVFKEIQVPIENKVIEVIEKPVIKEVIRYIERPVVKYVDRIVKRKKLNIPKYNFVASNQTRTYHKRNCRLGKLIKKKYKFQNNSQNFFKKKHYKGCKVCIKKQKKI